MQFFFKRCRRNSFPLLQNQTFSALNSNKTIYRVLPYSSSKFNFSDSKDQLKNIKESLRNEEKSLFNRLSEKFENFNQNLNPKTTSIINHTNKPLDLQSMNKLEIPTRSAASESEFTREKLNLKKLLKNAKEDQKSVNAYIITKQKNYKKEHIDRSKLNIY